MAFGIDVVDFGDQGFANLTLTTNRSQTNIFSNYYTPENAAVLFAGVIDPDGFDYVSFDDDIGADFVSYDSMYTRLYSAPVIPPMGGVPEPASWAMLIAGFGLTGAVVRQSGRHRRPHTVAA